MGRYNMYFKIGRMRALALVAAVPLMASCHDDGCWQCVSFTPYELSLGLVAGNFSHNGLASLIATSTVQYNAPYNAGNLKAYLSAGTNAFAAPTLISDGNDPLYLAASDLNGDGLPDVVSASYSDGSLNVFLNNTQSPGSFAAPRDAGIARRLASGHCGYDRRWHARFGLPPTSTRLPVRTNCSGDLCSSCEPVLGRRQLGCVGRFER